jgi:hypothetical protein
MYPYIQTWGFPPSIVMNNYTIEKIEVFQDRGYYNGYYGMPGITT